MEFLINAIEEFITNNREIVLLGTITIIEVAPIKINPWKWFGNLIIGDVQKELLEFKTNTMRWNILNFARDCRKGEAHSEEEWNHVISQLTEYEILCTEKKIKNGVIEETAVYLRELYNKRLHKNDFS